MWAVVMLKASEMEAPRLRRRQAATPTASGTSAHDRQTAPAPNRAHILASLANTSVLHRGGGAGLVHQPMSRGSCHASARVFAHLRGVRNLRCRQPPSATCDQVPECDQESSREQMRNSAPRL